MSNDTTTPPATGETPASLRAAADAGRAAQAELAQMRKENLFLRAGIPTGDDAPLAARLLFGSFDGTDIDALKAQAVELGIGKPAEPAPAGGEQAGDAAQEQFRQGLGAGTTPPAQQAQTPHPTHHALETFHQNTKNGMRDEDAALAAFDEVFVAGVKKDPRVIWTPNQQR